MEKELVEEFEGKRVKLFFQSGFNLIGDILKVYNETILFKTSQKTSAIPIDKIKELIEYD